MANLTLRHGLTQLGVLFSRPVAFLILGAYTVAWIVFDHASLDMHGVATLATWVMTLFIQRSGHRDTQALQAKVDELLRAHTEARTELAGLDQAEPEEIEAHRKAQRDLQP